MAAGDRLALVEKTVRLLEVMAQAGRPLRLKELSAGAGLAKSSAFRILFTLAALGYVERTPDGAYRLGLRVVALARGAASATQLANLARPRMQRLCEELGESVWLAERRGRQVYVVDGLEAPHPIGLSFGLGDACPLHASALGKSIAAYMPEEELEAALGNGGLPRYTARTITSRERLRVHLERVRRQGYAINDEETIIGAILIGAPIFDARGCAFAALSISTLSARCTPQRRRRLIARVRQEAEALTEALRSLGYYSAAG